MTGAKSFDDSVVRFTDSETVYDTDPSDKSLGYFQAVRFADSNPAQPRFVKPRAVCYRFDFQNPSDFSPDLSGFGTNHEELTEKLWLRPAQTARTDR